MGGSTDPRLARPLWRGRTNVDALTIACIEHAEQLGGHQFVITQGSYQAGAGDPNSAGTHDLGGVVDLRWCGHHKCLVALREAGMAAWLRTPAQGPWPHHIHAVVLQHPYLAPLAEQQTVSYMRGRNGLASNGYDDGPRLDPIPLPVWPWPPEEDDMPTPEEIAEAVWSHPLQKWDVGRGDKKDDTQPAAVAMEQARGFAALTAHRQTSGLVDQFRALRAAIREKASPEDVERALENLDATIQLVVRDSEG